jgi:uncharacterized membrane protein HdeD (DUF308 family)
MTATSAPSAPSATSMQTRARPWWLTLIMGITVFVLGAVLLWAPAKDKVDAYQFIIAFLGFYWLIGGIMEIVSLFVDRTAWGWKLFMGIVSIIAGSYVLMYPVAAGVALPRIFVLILGLWGLMQGILLLFLAFKGGGWGAGIMGVVAIIFGLILMGAYGNIGSGLVMIWTAAIWGVIGGIVLIVQAFRQRKA